MTREHLLLALILKLPIIFVISKIDLCPDEVLKNTLKDLNAILKRYKCNKTNVELNEENMNNYLDIHSSKIFPILKVSNTTGLNIKFIKKLFG